MNNSKPIGEVILETVKYELRADITRGRLKKGEVHDSSGRLNKKNSQLRVYKKDTGQQIFHSTQPELNVFLKEMMENTQIVEGLQKTSSKTVYVSLADVYEVIKSADDVPIMPDSVWNYICQSPSHADRSFQQAHSKLNKRILRKLSTKPKYIHHGHKKT